MYVFLNVIKSMCLAIVKLAKYERIGEMANNKYKFELAWKYLNSCTYFTKPYFNDDGSLVTFSNEFKDSLDITVDQNFVYLECGSWSLDSKVWYHDYKLNTKGTSFEKAVVKLYRKIYEICGEDYTDNYFHIDDIKNINKCFVKQENGNYSFVANNSN